jgi:hypothetical protein
MPPHISDRPPAVEPRQVSIPAAARPGAAMVGVVDDAPDVLPSVWA